MAKTREQLVDVLRKLEAALPRLRKDNADETDYAMAFMAATEELIEDVCEDDMTWFVSRLRALQRRYRSVALTATMDDRLVA